MRLAKRIPAAFWADSPGRSWAVLATVLALLSLVPLLLAGCAEVPSIAAVAPTPTVYELPPTDIPSPPPGPTPEALNFPLPAPPHEEAVPVDDGTCVECHTDEETLKALAEEEEAPEVESEGEG